MRRRTRARIGEDIWAIIATGERRRGRVGGFKRSWPAVGQLGGEAIRRREGASYSSEMFKQQSW